MASQTQILDILRNSSSKSLGVAVFDYDNDGWPDIFVANDTQPNKLYRNNHDGTFTEQGVEAGVAWEEDGVARGAMGTDFGDYDRSGRAHLLVGNFTSQMLALYHNEGNGTFVDEAAASSLGRSSLLAVTFGLFFLITISMGSLIFLRRMAISSRASTAYSREFNMRKRPCSFITKETGDLMTSATGWVKPSRTGS